MSFGMLKAGVKVIGGIDVDETCRATYEANNPGSKFLCEDVAKYGPHDLARETGIKKNDNNLLFIGCSPCQYWSLLHTNKSKSKKTAFLLEHFQKHVEYFRPGYLVIENVPGILKKEDSPLDSFRKALFRWGYKISEQIVNASDYGVPQNRRRFVLIASRLSAVAIPKPCAKRRKTVADVLGIKNGFPQINAGEKHEHVSWHIAASLSDSNKRRIEKTPPDGGTRKLWQSDKLLQLDAYQNRENQFADVYGRMFWHRPAPTITTRFISISNGRFGHPNENRGISIREGACLQSFPKGFKILSKGLQDAARLIGNAVPPKLAHALGKAIIAGAEDA